MIKWLVERLLLSEGQTLVKIKGWNCFLVDGPHGKRTTIWPVWDIWRVFNVLKRIVTGQPKPPKPATSAHYESYIVCACGQVNCTAHGVGYGYTRFVKRSEK